MKSMRCTIDSSLLLPRARCDNCGREDPSRKCCRCSQVFYCSAECQARGFFHHHCFCQKTMQLSAEIIKQMKNWFQKNYSSFKILAYRALNITQLINREALVLSISVFENSVGKPLFHLMKYQLEDFETISFEDMIKVKRLENVARKKLYDIERNIVDKALLILTINTIRSELNNRMVLLRNQS